MTRRIGGGPVGVTRSASSIYNSSYEVMHGELNYAGDGMHGWCPKAQN
jgi:hypothetical protein